MEKIYGLYGGSINDTNIIDNLNEVELFYKIGTYAYRIENGKDKKQIEEDVYALEYCIYQTTKFGVMLEEPEENYHIEITPSYLAWYSFYDDHFRKVLTIQEKCNLQFALACKSDISKYMPEGNWEDLLEEPKIKKYA